MTQVVAEDIALVRDHGCHIMHCPKSNLKLASGFCPITKFIANGVNVSLGTDSAASNNGLDLFSEMQTASLLAKAVSGDATSLGAHDTLRMATISGALALGWENEIGSLEPGKYADLIAVKINSISQQPLYNPASQLVYTNAGSHVTHSWVAGRKLLDDGQLQTIDEYSLIQKTEQWRNRIQGSDTAGQ
jgi:5-methylthioadenosine/S-adenosylhomocysteine deaminase